MSDSCLNFLDKVGSDLDMVVHACDFRTQEAEAGGS
jgi:hypothetical protein